MNFSQPGTRAEAISSIMANVQIAKNLQMWQNFRIWSGFFFAIARESSNEKKKLDQMAKLFPICKWIFFAIKRLP